MIDLAVHAAGLAAIPVGALLRRSGVQSALSQLVELALHAVAEDRSGAAIGWAQGGGDESPLPNSVLPAPLVACQPPGEITNPSQLVVDALPESVFSGLLVQEAIAAAGAVLQEPDPATGSDSRADGAAGARRLLHSVLESTRLADGTPLSMLLLRLLERCEGERSILGAALSVLPGGALFVCHGVDLEHRLGGPPRRSLMDQLAGLRLLGLAGRGRIVSFVPCDPWRPQAVAVVREALSRGFAGVSILGSSIPDDGGTAAGQPRSRSGPSREAATRLREVLGVCTAAGAPVVVLLGSGALDFAVGGASAPDGAGRVEALASLLDHRRFASLRVLLVPGGPGFSVETSDRGDRSPIEVEVDDELEATLSLSAERPGTWCALSPALAAVGASAVAETDAEAVALWSKGVVGAVRRAPCLGDRLAMATSLPHGDHLLVAAGRANLPGLLRAAKAKPTFTSRFEERNALEFLGLDRLLKRSAGALSTEEVDGLRRLLGSPSRARPPAKSQGPAMDLLSKASVSSLAPARAPGRPAAHIRPVAASATAAPMAARSMAAPMLDADCIVVGAGIAGVTAADRISRLPNGRGSLCRVLLLEASSRIGGRLHTWRDGPRGPLELGAELVHRPRLDQILGNFRLWDDLDRFGLGTRKIDKLSASYVHARHWSAAGPDLRAGCGICGDAGAALGLEVLNRAAGWTTTGGTPDPLAGDLLQSVAGSGVLAKQMGDLLLTGTVPGRLHELSVAGLAADRVKDQEMSSEEFHVQAGFDALAEALGRSVEVRRGAVVDRITRGPAGVSVRCTDGSVLVARCAVCTVSVGVLKSGAISFDPPLPGAKRQALDRLELGPISKAILFFDRPFWPSGMSILGALDPARRAGRSYFVPLYGADPTAPVITGLFNGDLARRLDQAMAGHSDADSDAALPQSVRRDVEAIMDLAAEDLREVFGRPAPSPSLLRWRVRSWANDPFVRGGTSFVRHVPGSTSRESARVRLALRDPTPPLFWAGEATAVHTNPWSVHGAHASGVQAALEVGEFLRPTGDW